VLGGRRRLFFACLDFQPTISRNTPSVAMRLKHLSATSCEARIRTPSVLRWESTVPLPENLESPCGWHCTVPSMALDESGSPPAFRSPYVLPYGLAPASCVLRAAKHHVVGSSSSSLFWLDVNVCIAYDITCAGTQETGKRHGKQFGARLFKLDEVISVAGPTWTCVLLNHQTCWLRSNYRCPDEEASLPNSRSESRQPQW